MLIVVAVVAGLAAGLMSEAARRRFGTVGALVTVVLGCALAVAAWVPHSGSREAGWAVVAFMLACNLTDLVGRKTLPMRQTGV